MKTDNEFNLGYLAGIIEGEGCFEVRKDKISEGIDACVTVTSESIQLMQWLTSNFQGKIYKNESTKTFQWIIRKNDNFLPILKQLELKLLFKKEQCRSMIELMEGLKEPHSGLPLTEEVIKERGILLLEHAKAVNMLHQVKKAGRKNEKVFLALSGGMDSTTLLYYLQWLGLEVETYTLNYGQKHNKEIEHAKKIASKAKVKHTVLDMSNLQEILSNSSLTSSKDVPHGHYTDETMKQTVVPFRNSIILSIAVGYAVSKGIENVAFAAHASDYTIYPDCRTKYVALMENLAKVGNYDSVNVFAPFLSLTKPNVCFLGLLLGVPFEDTWSCYEGKEEPCGECGTCVERTESFLLAGVKDPTFSDEGWGKAVKYFNSVNDPLVK